MKTYLLTHYYVKDRSTYDIKFASNLKSSKLEKAIASIMFLADDIKHGSDFGGIEIALLLKAFFDKDLKFLDFDEEVEFQIDEYDVWEYYAGKSDEVVNEVCDDKVGMILAIQHLLDHAETLLNLDPEDL